MPSSVDMVTMRFGETQAMTEFLAMMAMTLLMGATATT